MAQDTGLRLKLVRLCVVALATTTLVLFSSSMAFAQTPLAQRVKLNIDPVGTVNAPDGSATVTGNLECTGDLFVEHFESHLVQRLGRAVLRAEQGSDVFDCDDEVVDWVQPYSSPDGLFVPGRATVTFIVRVLDQNTGERVSIEPPPVDVQLRGSRP
jgi:hypothetical protein